MTAEAPPALPGLEPSTEVRSYLMEALATAQERALAVAKKGDDPRFGAKTLTKTEDILVVVKEANTGLGLSIAPVRCPIVRNAAGDPIAINRVIAIRHSSGESIEFETEWPVERKLRKDGSPSQGWDDAIATAQTRSLGYLLRDAYGLPRLKEEDMPPGAAEHTGPEKLEEPSAWDIRKSEWNKLARQVIGTGVSKERLVGLLQKLGADISNDAKWGKEPSEEVAKKVEAFLANPSSAAAKSSSAAAAANPSTSSTTGTQTSTTGTAASRSDAKVEPPKANAPITPAEKAAAIDVPEPEVPKKKRDALGAAAVVAIENYGKSKAEMVQLFRKWSGADSFVTDGGKFPDSITAEQYQRAVAGFKAWEKERQAAQRNGSSPEEVADEAAKEWEKASAEGAPSSQ